MIHFLKGSMTNMSQKILKLTLSALFASGMMLLSQGQASARMMPPHKMMHGQGHKGHCMQVQISGKYAMAKAMPNMNARTLRMIPRGEMLTMVMDKWGPHHKNGWWLVRSKMGHRYWVHQSMVSCHPMMKNNTMKRNMM